MNRNNKAYRKVLEHRRNCPKWGKEFCLECFGGGLNKFTDNYNDEENLELGLPKTEELIKNYLKYMKFVDDLREFRLLKDKEREKHKLNINKNNKTKRKSKKKSLTI